MTETHAQRPVARQVADRHVFIPVLAAWIVVAGMAGMRSALAADASPWVVEEVARTRLIAAAETLSATGEIQLGLQIRMPPGWKTYWRSPGRAGVPTELDAKKSRNLEHLRVNWPLPKRFKVSGIETIGYKDEVVLPVIARARDPHRPLDLDIRVRFGVCREICVPLEADHRLTVPPSGRHPVGRTRHAGLIAFYRAQVPPPGPRPDLAVAHISVLLAETPPVLEIVARSERPFARPDAFVEGPGAYVFGAPAVSVAADRRRAVLRLPVYGGDAGGLDGAALRITLFDHAGGAVELVMTATDGREAGE